MSGRLPIVDDEQAEWKRWRWTKVGRVHSADRDGAKDCDGVVYQHVYRFHPQESRLYERCISLIWCSSCRECSSAMVHAPREHVLDDPLAALGALERDRIRRSETRLLNYLDRLVRRGAWLPASPRTEQA